MENKLEDLEFFDFDTSLTISETAFDAVENNQAISKPAANFYIYWDNGNEQVLLDLPRVIKLREWLDKFIAKNSE